MTGLYLDSDVDVRAGGLISQGGCMAVTARIMGMLRAADHEHLLLAAERGWTLITHNGRDFRFLHRIWCHWPLQITHSGILVLGHADPHDVAYDSLAFVRRGLPLANRLYHKSPDGGWVVDRT